MSGKQPNAYLRTDVMTASPAQLRLMLLDGAIRFAEQGREGLVKKDYEAMYTGLSRCQNILIELITSLQPEHNPQLAKQISTLYTYLYTQLVAAVTHRDATMVDEVLERLRYERETWAMLLEQLAEENRAAGSMDETPNALPPGSTASSSLVGGTVSFRG